MKISDLFNKSKTIISFEIFPPKNNSNLDTTYEKIAELKKLNPAFISVTYGAGGSEKGLTIELSNKIQNHYNIECMSHLTSIGHSIVEINDILTKLKKYNINNILALRGDIPTSDMNFNLSKNVFKHAGELVEYINKYHNFNISAAAYVEGHLDSKSIKEDLFSLKAKVDSGVDFLITQLFFDNRIFYDYVDRAIGIGISCPISAGIMPILNANIIKKITLKSGCSFPSKIVNMMDKYQDNPDDMKKAGIEYAAFQIQNLIDNNVDGIHLYTMNRPVTTKQILDLLNNYQE